METIASRIEDPAGGEVPSKEAEQARFARLDAMGESLAKTRAEAIAARATSGIEDEWREDEEFYQGMDDANRAEHKNSAWRSKPPGQANPSTNAGTRSTVFPNVTRPYVDAAAARIADMLLPTDDRSWGLGPTPIPEADGAAKGKYSPDMLKAVAGKHPGDPAAAQKELLLAAKAAKEVVAEAKAKADKAQTRIEDWMVECQWHAQVRLVIEDAARIGTGVLKGPVPIKKSGFAYKGGFQRKQEIKPGSKWLDPWNVFPDPACGESIHNGSYIWERDALTKRQLRELKGQEGYINAQIDACLTEGATRAIGEFKQVVDMAVGEAAEKEKFEVWYFHGTVEREDLEAAGCDCTGVEDPNVPAMIVMVNNRVIKAVLNPLDTGEFPYDVMVWQRRAGFWAGIGVARQIRTPQRIVTAAVRNLMDNAGIAAGPMLVYMSGLVTPADGKAGIAPRKVWTIAQDAEGIKEATDAIGTIKVDMLVNELMQIIQLGLKLAEDVTGLPMLLQGQMGKAPDTLGGMQMLNNNASAVLRRLARLFDDRITEPHVRRYYVWLLLDPAVPEDEKGDYCIDARGSSALVERDLQNQAVMQMGQLVLDPRFGKDPKKWMDEHLKAQRLDPSRFDYDDEQWQQIVENMQKGPQDPRMAVAQLRAEGEERARQQEAALKQLEMQFEESENAKDRALDAWVAQLDQQGAKSISLDQLKARLADTTIKARLQRDLSAADGAKQVMRPPSEPKGRAPRGQAFQH